MESANELNLRVPSAYEHTNLVLHNLPTTDPARQLIRLSVCACVCVRVHVCVSGRKQDIIKVTEQLIEAISNGDFESYTYVTSTEHAQAEGMFVCLFLNKTIKALRNP